MVNLKQWIIVISTTYAVFFFLYTHVRRISKRQAIFALARVF